MIGTAGGRTRVGHFADIDRPGSRRTRDSRRRYGLAPGTAVMPTGATASQICSARIPNQVPR